jgi:hypothetical protein
LKRTLQNDFDILLKTVQNQNNGLVFCWEMSIHSAIVSQLGLDLQNGFDLLKGKLTDGFGLPGELQNGLIFAETM